MKKYITNIKDMVIPVFENDSEIKAKMEISDDLSCF